MKRLAKSALKAAVMRMPWGANEALFEAFRIRMGNAEIMARCAPRLDHLCLCADGSYGLIQSALNDGLLLPAYARTGVYEPRLDKLFHEFFTRSGGGTYLDIGANIGLTTIPVAQEKTIKCLAFEPDPANSHHLRANIERNCPHRNVTVHQIALFTTNSMLNFVLNDQNIGDHRLALGQRRAGHTIQVEAAPLDQFASEIVGAVAAKIDTQGAEPFVIAGGRDVLSRARLVALEFSPFHMQALGSDPSVVLEFLAGFEQIGIGSNRGDDLPILRPAAEAVSQLKDLLAAWRNGEQRYWDVVASR
ncbi:MAG: FkbM family methyltransferase [Acidobacteria bacterium]|nr:FkbM family methyltransferase [Acidobacteriota bacterium]